MGDAADIFAMGADVLVGVVGAVTGYLLPQDGSASVAFSGGVFDDETKARPGKPGEIATTRDLLLPSAGIASEPHPGDRITFTGDSRTWDVVEVDPISPGGGAAVAWRLTLSDFENTEE